MNDRVYDLQDTSNYVRCAAVADIQFVIPAEYTVSMLPGEKAFGWTGKYINDLSLIPL